MALENLSSTTIVAQQVNAPFLFNLTVFLIIFAITVLYSSLLLWLTIRFFRLKGRYQFKTAFFVALISNVVVSFLFGIVRLIAGQAFGEVSSANTSILVVVIISAFVFAVIFGINFFIANKFYTFPAKKAFYIVLSWTLISFLVTNLTTQIFAPLIANLVLSFYPVAGIAASSYIIPPPA